MNMKHEKLLELAKPHLERNELSVEHTLRVLEIAKKNFNKYNLDESSKDIVFSLIVLHDIGGSTKRQQYKKGPEIAKKLLEKLGYHSFDIKLICTFIAKHHERLSNPDDTFKILFDSDQLVKFSNEEFEHYNSKLFFNWNKIIESFYHPDIKEEAKKLLAKRLHVQNKK